MSTTKPPAAPPKEEEEEDTDALIGMIGSLKLEAEGKKEKKEAPPSQNKDAEDDAALAELLQDGLKLSPTPSKAVLLTLRPYQQLLVHGVAKEFAQGSQSVLMYLPTGGGKSAICATIAKSESHVGRRVGIFVHRDELAEQMHGMLRLWLKRTDKTGEEEEEVGFIKANKKPSTSSKCRIHIVSIQTFAKRYLRQSDDDDTAATLPPPPPPPFDLIIIDEAHHAMAPEYVQLKQLYTTTAAAAGASSTTRLLGVTATPFRLKRGEMLGDLFQSSVFGPSMSELQRQGFLVPFVCMRSSFTGQGQVGRKAAQHADVINAAVKTWKKRHSASKTLAFCLNLAHAALVSDAFEREGVRAAVLSGKDKPARRDELFAQSREGDVSVLCTVDVVSEGVDTVWVDCLLMLRPTESLGLYIQQLGRGLRPHAGKTVCTVLDEVGNVWDHGFVDELDMEHEMKKNKKDGTDDRSPPQRLGIYPCQGYRCRALASKNKNKLCCVCAKEQEDAPQKPPVVVVSKAA